jgi:NADPH:quinone reductase-like Zn-dependent oxidoreductase
MANQAWTIPRHGILELKDLGPLPKPGPKQVLIRIQAVSINYRDVLVVAGSHDYPLIAKPGLVPCSDGAGVVEEAGPESVWKKCDHVVIHPNTWFEDEDPRAMNL